MHIPISPTTYLDVLPFEDALEAALCPHAEYAVEDWLYVPDRYEVEFSSNTLHLRPKNTDY